jgi:prepilin signal peptidase PulO-like enzyme (type II secretory pathway)
VAPAPDVIAAWVAAAAGVPLGLVIDVAAERLAREYHTVTQDEDQGTESATESPPYFLNAGAGWRRVAVVAATVVLGFGVGAQHGDGWQPIVAMAYIGVLIGCTVTDLLSRRLPNVFLYPAIALAFVTGMVAPGADRVDVLAGGALSGGIFLAMALLPQGGLGDAKLGLFTGLALGLELVVPAIIITAIAGAAASMLILIATRFRALHRPFPYGQYIALGALVVMLFGGTAFARV